MLRDEIVPFIDGNNLVSPQPFAPGTKRASGNGVMYTSEYYILLKYRGEDHPSDLQEFRERIQPCVIEPGLVARSPWPDTEQQQGDDLYALAAACKVYGITDLPGEILDYGKRHFGFFNTQVPGTFKGLDGKILWKAWLWRYVPLFTALHAASDRPDTTLTRLMYLVTAIVIAFSSKAAPASDTDARRLSWLLIQAVAGKSKFCELASRIWFARLYKTYSNGMRGVAQLYYSSSHPFPKYFVDGPYAVRS